jgi:hypothetical protein
MNQLADAVKVTLGPKGRNVVLEKKRRPHDYMFGAPVYNRDNDRSAGYSRVGRVGSS